MSVINNFSAVLYVLVGDIFAFYVLHTLYHTVSMIVYRDCAKDTECE